MFRSRSPSGKAPGRPGMGRPKPPARHRGTIWSRATFPERSFSPAGRASGYWGTGAGAVPAGQVGLPGWQGTLPQPAPPRPGPEAGTRKVKSDPQVCRLGEGATQEPLIKGKAKEKMSRCREDGIEPVSRPRAAPPPPSAAPSPAQSVQAHTWLRVCVCPLRPRLARRPPKGKTDLAGAC